MIDVISGGRLIAGFPVGTPMDTCFAYGQNPSMLRERYLEAHDLVMRAWTGAGHLCLQRPLQPAALRQHLAAPGAEAAPADLDPGRRLGRDLAVVRADGLRLRLPVLFRLQGRPGDDEGFWEEMERLGKDRNPYRAGFLQFVGVAESREQAMELYREPAEYFYGRCLRVDPRWAMPPGYITEATQRAGIVGQIGRAASLDARQKARATTQMEDIVERGYVIIGSPDEVVEQLTEVATEPQCRPPDAAPAVRQHGQGPGQVQHQAVRRAGHAAAQGPVPRMGRPLVAAADGRAPSAPTPAPFAGAMAAE